MSNRIVLDVNGLKVSKAGIDVLTETNPNNFIFRAQDPGAGVFLTGSITGSSGPVTVSFGTTFSYIPFVMVATKTLGATVSYQAVLASSTLNVPFAPDVTTSNMTFNVLVPDSTYYYAVFYMRAR